MEVYILDSLYRRSQVSDRYESLIWTERFAAYGDFELIVHSTVQSRNRFIPGVRLAIKESSRVMTVETTEDTTDNEGRMLLKVKGRSLEGILQNRLALAALTDLTTDPKWILEGFPLDIAAQIFHDICVTGILDVGDIIPGVVEGSIYSADTNPAPSEEIIYSIDPMTVYDAIKNLCDVYDMGFRLVRDLDTSILYFDIYMGSDRTTQQTDLAAVVFSPDLDNLKNTTLLTSIALYKNAAYVISPVGHEVVYPLDVDPAVNGFDRQVLLVKADDITDVIPADATAKMIQRGKEELAKSRRFTGFDGELAQTNKYVYDTDYSLGDFVELRNDEGTTSIMQVTEQIFVSDRQGVRSYPTLSIKTFVTPGSWLAWPYSEVWDDVDPDLDWDELP